MSFSFKSRLLLLAVATSMSVLLMQCQSTPDMTMSADGKASHLTPEIETLIESGEAVPAGEALPITGNETVLRKSASLGVSFTNTFGDKTSCNWNPEICKNSFVVWPGYYHSVAGGEYNHVWMSKGPGTAMIAHGTGEHFHIVGLFDPKTEPNPAHSAMFGKDWIVITHQRNGQRVKFDLNQILVKTKPIALWL